MKKRTKLLLALSAALCLSFGMATFAACGDKNDPPADHTEHVDVDPQDGKCDVCGDDMPAPAEKTYTVTFNSNGGSTVNAVTVKEGEKATRPTDPTKQDKNFGGWYTDAACSDGNEYNFDAAVTGNITLYAKWTDKTAEKTTWTVTFDTGEGSKVDPQEVAKNNGRASKPATDPTRTGYRFDGWYAESGCTHAFNFSNRITADTTIYAKWVKVNTVTFDTGDGASKVQAQVLEEGVKPTEPETEPTKEGYIFKGWYTAAENGEEFDFNADLTGDVTVYAHWEQDAGYYNQDGWLIREGKLVSYTGDKTNITIPDALEELDDISQLVQYADDLKDVKLESAESHFKIENNALWSKDGSVLYAFWDQDATEFICDTAVDVRAHAFHMSYSGSGTSLFYQMTYIRINATKIGERAFFGSLATNVKCPVTIILTNTNLTEIGEWAFASCPQLSAVEIHSEVVPACGSEAFRNSNNFKLGIYVPDDMIEQYTSASYWSTLDKNNKNIVALSTRQYTVTFDAGDGASAVNPQTVKRGQKATEPETPVKSGYALEGWYKDKAHTQKFDFANDTITQDTTLYANWTESATWTLTYDLGEGDTTTLPAQLVNKGEMPHKPNDPKKEGKKLVGWYTKSESEGWGEEYTFDSPLSSDTTIYAKWETCEHKDGYTFDYTEAPGATAEGGTLKAKCAVCGGETTITYSTGVIAATSSDDPTSVKEEDTVYAVSKDGNSNCWFGIVIKSPGTYTLTFTSVHRGTEKITGALYDFYAANLAYCTSEFGSAGAIIAFNSWAADRDEDFTELGRRLKSTLMVNGQPYDPRNAPENSMTVSFTVTSEDLAAGDLYVSINYYYKGRKKGNPLSSVLLSVSSQKANVRSDIQAEQVALLPGKQNY